jgi:hypothetical protein
MPNPNIDGHFRALLLRECRGYWALIAMRVQSKIKLAAVIFVATLTACQTTGVDTKATPPAAPPAPQEDFAAASNLISKKDLPLRGVAIVEKLVTAKKLPGQFAAQTVAFMGIESAAEKIHFGGMKPTTHVPMPITDMQARDAIQEIVAAAKTHRVVIINESHWHQRHRAFAHLLAKELRAVGYTHLGIEALAPNTGEQVRRRGPRVGDGFYTMDPFFADFIRQSMAMGYYVFDYEQRPDQALPDSADRTATIAARERAQAANIAQILNANPNAKAMIYVGGGHGMKVPADQGHEMMALQLNRVTGLDIVSINQSAGTPDSARLFDPPPYQSVAPLLLKRRSTVIRNKDGQWLASPGYDFTVFHPRLPDIYGRAGWMEMDGYRKLHLVNLAPLAARTMLRARALPIVEGNVAFDQVVVASQQREAALFLPAGEYALFREFESGVTESVGRAVVK